jgi:hypothetical protein
MQAPSIFAPSIFGCDSDRGEADRVDILLFKLPPHGVNWQFT